MCSDATQGHVIASLWIDSEVRHFARAGGSGTHDHSRVDVSSAIQGALPRAAAASRCFGAAQESKIRLVDVAAACCR